MDGHLISISQRCDGLTAEAFFAAAAGRERYYWNDGHMAAAGMGIAAELTAWGERRFEAVAEKARALMAGVQFLGASSPKTKPRLFGGFSFQPEFVTERIWAQFAPAYFVLPHYQLTCADGETWLTLHVQLGPDEAVDADGLAQALDEQCALLAQAASARQAEPRRAPVQVNYPMPFETWASTIQAAVGAMSAGALRKVVLARVCEVRFDGLVDVDGALGFLNRAYADCIRFAFEPIPHLTFFGATPELLVSVQGTHLETEALAGSIRRGAQPEDDEALGCTLLADPKERSEHQHVVDGIRDRLAGVAASIHHAAVPQLRRLKNIQHLHTPIEAELLQPQGVLPLVDLLHPTPALGGSPREEALAFIRTAEPVPRGWYAAPIGWIDADLDGAFAVAIRSAVSQGDRVWLYAGAGIMPTSQPDREWAETALKFRPMLNALGVPPDASA